MTTITSAKGSACRSKPRTDLIAFPVHKFLQRCRVNFRFSGQIRVLGIGLMLFMVVLQAQTRTSIVYGTISRQNNQPATKVLVSIARKIAYTDDGGRYRLNGVPFGPQEMLVSSGGKVVLQSAVNINSSAQRIDKKLP